MIAAMVLALVAGAPGSGGCDGVADAARFGDWLAERGDYYRAIGEYQRGIFLGSGAACGEEQLSLRIARAYALGDQADAAAASGRELAREASDGSIRSEAVLVLAYARLRAGDVESAASLSRSLHGAAAGTDASVSRRSRVVAALALLRSDGGERAAIRTVEPIGDAADLSAAARKVRTAAEALERAPRKSPALAGALSAVVPGLGHLYLGEPGAGAGAFAVNAVFAWATLDAFRARRYGLGAAALAIESLWYGGAIFGAVAGAHRYNRDGRALVLEELDASLRADRDLLPLPPALGVSARGSF